MSCLCKPLCVDGHRTVCIMLQGWWGTERLESENKEDTAEETLRKHDQRNKRSKETPRIKFQYIWYIFGISTARCIHTVQSLPFIFYKICPSTKLILENWTDTLYMYQKASEVFSDMCAHNCKAKSLISYTCKLRLICLHWQISLMLLRRPHLTLTKTTWRFQPMKKE